MSCIFLSCHHYFGKPNSKFLKFLFCNYLYLEGKVLKSAIWHVNSDKSQTNIDKYLSNYKYFPKGAQNGI